MNDLKQDPNPENILISFNLSVLSCIEDLRGTPTSIKWILCKSCLSYLYTLLYIHSTYNYMQTNNYLQT